MTSWASWRFKGRRCLSSKVLHRQNWALLAAAQFCGEQETLDIVYQLSASWKSYLHSQPCKIIVHHCRSHFHNIRLFSPTLEWEFTVQHVCSGSWKLANSYHFSLHFGSFSFYHPVLTTCGHSRNWCEHSTGKLRCSHASRAESPLTPGSFWSCHWLCKAWN